MTRRHATRIDRVAQPSYFALAFEIGDFLEKRHTLLRTSTDVATRPWRTPRLRAAGPGPPCTREYVKDHVSRGLPPRNATIIPKIRKSGRRKSGVDWLVGWWVENSLHPNGGEPSPTLAFAFTCGEGDRSSTRRSSCARLPRATAPGRRRRPRPCRRWRSARRARGCWSCRR